MDAKYINTDSNSSAVGQSGHGSCCQPSWVLQDWPRNVSSKLPQLLFIDRKAVAEDGRLATSWTSPSSHRFGQITNGFHAGFRSLRLLRGSFGFRGGSAAKAKEALQTT
mmetsp:Transcript_4849/g.7727  ORF Transcript_4849/g.7727 Transcript_4849/m.7727 type:complete len:109 (-) Transcript_4849:326-652(-)